MFKLLLVPRSLYPVEAFPPQCFYKVPKIFQHAGWVKYGVYMLEKITGTTNSDDYVMYDIACSLSTL